eukprot:CAMPEP_0176297500 /NCGR_PEP_ID=MMETSP0121_2-20121125/58753_1 /TAXON_ID=160619 /ORGANISM="Kryptoperidinium foliaceum, Strain CCMP 1326" /LENGTH=72 /DNA_ID=CAMNT_0017638689 /DNA_START=135 /DNA_END=353 /DNA_ORIENTATION=-
MSRHARPRPHASLQQPLQKLAAGGQDFGGLFQVRIVNRIGKPPAKISLRLGVAGLGVRQVAESASTAINAPA